MKHKKHLPAPTIARVILILLLPCAVWSQAGYEQLYTGSEDILLVSEAPDQSVLAWATVSGLHIKRNDQVRTFSSVNYSVQGQNFSADLKGIRDLVVDRYGSVFVSTTDNNLLRFAEGELKEGFPVETTRFRRQEKNIYTILKLAQTHFPARILDDLSEFDPQVSTFEAALLSTFTALDGQAIYQQGILAGDGKRVAVWYESGSEMHVHDTQMEFAPCTEFVEMVGFEKFDDKAVRNPSSAQAFVCKNGNLAWAAIPLNNINDWSRSWQMEEWREIRLADYGLAQPAPRLYLPRDEGNDVETRFNIFGFTQENSPAIYIYNPREQQVCSFRPGRGTIRDLDVLSNRSVVFAAGSRIHRMTIDRDFVCSAATPATAAFAGEDGWRAYAVSATQFVIEMPDNRPSTDLPQVHLFDMTGRAAPVTVQMSGRQIRATTPPLAAGVYIVRIMEDGRVTGRKLVLGR